MNKKVRISFLAIIVVVTYSLILLATILAPWFSWWKNALSDLGHCTKSQVAALFNFSLSLGGFLIALYSIVFLRSDTRFCWLLLTISGFSLQLIGTFDEYYGYLHFLVSVAFFATFGLTLLAYSIERKYKAGAILFVIYVMIWVTYYRGVLGEGVSVPEFASSLMASVFFLLGELEKLK